MTVALREMEIEREGEAGSSRDGKQKRDAAGKKGLKRQKESVNGHRD